jgi:hypothetical protein
MRWAALTVVLLLMPVAWGQTEADRFVIDSSKPYVFIEFDHVGDRKPLSGSESRRGVWLRVVSNCRVPITIDAFDLGTGDPGMGIFYDIIPVKPHAGWAGTSGEVQGLEGPKNVPQGYYFSNQTISHVTIPSGGNLLFSVPSNHIQPEWYLQAKFQFDLPSTSAGRQPQPISLLRFIWLDLPDKFRASDNR